MHSPTPVSNPAARAVAWGGAGVFVLSLAFFLFSYDVTFRSDAAGAVSIGTIVFNTTLFSIFALHHSLFARSGLRGWVERRFGVLERSVYVWIASVLFILVCALWRPVPGVVWQVYEWPAILLRLLHVTGAVLSVVSAAAIDVWDLAGVRQVSSARSTMSAGLDEFKTNRHYGYVRHPIYPGSFLNVFAVPHMTATRFVFAIVSSLYVLIAIPFEERSLLTSTTGAYQRYRDKVRFRIVPGVY